MDPKAQSELVQGWNKLHAGIENSHKTAVLTNGADIVRLSVDAQAAQLTDQARLSIIEIANLIGAPPHKAGDNTRAAYNSLEQENQSFLDDSIDWRAVDWEHELWDKVLTEQQKRTNSHAILFDRKSLLRADLATKAEYYAKALSGAPWMTIDQVRVEEDYNELDGSEGDEIKYPNSFKDAPVAVNADGTEAVDVNAELREQMETYGIGVRAGSLTPQTVDEEYFRNLAGLPPLGKDAQKAWTADKGVRRPITLASVADTRVDGAEAPGGEDPNVEDVGSTPFENRSAHRALLLHSCQKMAERIAKNSQRLAKKPGFSAAAYSLAEDHKAVMLDEFGPVLAVANVGQTAGGLADSIIKLASDELLEMMRIDSKSGREGAIAEWSTRFTGPAMENLVNNLFEDKAP
jgi:hypothetical protein